MDSLVLMFEADVIALPAVVYFFGDLFVAEDENWEGQGQAGHSSVTPWQIPARRKSWTIDWQPIWPQRHVGTNETIKGFRSIDTGKELGSWTFPVFELQGVGGLNPIYLILPTPYLWSKFDPEGSSFNAPPKFCWSWYATWFTSLSNAVLKISTAWGFECY